MRERPFSPMLPLVLTFTAVALTLIVLAIPLIRRRVKPNRLYGVRVAATFADEWVWYEANARSGRDLLVLGAIQLACALVPLLMPRVTAEAYTIGNTAVLLGGTLIFAVAGWRRANRLLAERRAQ